MVQEFTLHLAEKVTGMLLEIDDSDKISEKTFIENTSLKKKC